MPFKNEYSLQRRKYAQISVKKRVILVQLVLQSGKSLAQASRKLNIKPSTAKLIVKKYQQTGQFFMKKLKNAVKPTQANENRANEERGEIKVEEPDEILPQQQANAAQATPSSESGLMWYGYRLFPYNYQSPYCGA